MFLCTKELYLLFAHVCALGYTKGMLTKEEKQNTAQQTRIHDKDTGSSSAQVAVLTKRIQQLSGHLKGNHKDKHSRRGLVGLVEKRRKHLSYLRKRNTELYKKTIETLGLRK